jgi:His-Xaa-Ser system protein HxsD
VSEIVLEFDASQSAGALREAAYRLIGDASCQIEQVEGRHICRIFPKRATTSREDDLRFKFLDFVTDANLREKIDTETAGLRNVIVALAFGAIAQERRSST